MSSSEEDSKIDLLDKPEIVNRKIDSALCLKENIEENGVLAFFQFVVLPIVHPKPIMIAGKKEYTSFEEIQKDFLSENLSEMELKTFLKVNICVSKRFSCVVYAFASSHFCYSILGTFLGVFWDDFRSFLDV